MIELARRYGRYGYRRIAALLRDAGWQVNDKRVERLWRREGLKVPGKQPKRGRLWLNDGSCVRLRAGRADHVWLYGRLPERKDRFGCDGQADCSFVSGLWCGAFCPLALMESADPRLICPVGFSPFNDIQAWRIAV